MFCFSIKDTRKESRSNGIYCVLILALAAIIAVSVALAVVVIRNEEGDNDSSQKAETGANMQTPHALPSTTTDPNIITSTRGTRKSVRFTFRVSYDNIVTVYSYELCFCLYFTEVCNSPECVRAG